MSVGYERELSLDMVNLSMLAYEGRRGSSRM